MVCLLAEKLRFSLQPEVQYRALFSEIMDTILVQLKHRFKSVKDIGFVELLDCKQYHFYNFANNFPERSFQCLQEMYKFLFEFFRLRSELQVLYSHSVFAKTALKSSIDTCMKMTCMVVLRKCINWLSPYHIQLHQWSVHFLH